MSDEKRITQISEWPSGSILGVPSLLIEDEGTYHLKAAISDKDVDALQRAAMSVVQFRMGEGGSDCKLAKSTILRLSMMLRKDSAYVFPKLKVLQVDHPENINILPLLLSPALNEIRLEHWYSKPAREGSGSKPNKMSRQPVDEADLTWFMNAVANTAKDSFNALVINGAVPQGILNTIGAFVGLTRLELLHVVPSGDAETLGRVFDAVGGLNKLVQFGFHCNHRFPSVPNPPAAASDPPPRQFNLETASLQATREVFSFMARRFDIAVQGTATIMLVYPNSPKDEANREATLFFNHFLKGFFERSQLKNLNLSSSTTGHIRLPFTQLSQAFNLRAGQLSFLGWELQLNDVEKAADLQYFRCGEIPSLQTLEFDEKCQWTGLSLHSLLTISRVHLRLKRLRSAIKIEDVSQIDTSALDRSSPCALETLSVWEPEGATGELDIKTLIGVAKYLKRVFPKLRELDCSGPDEAGRRWMLVKEVIG